MCVCGSARERIRSDLGRAAGLKGSCGESGEQIAISSYLTGKMMTKRAHDRIAASTAEWLFSVKRAVLTLVLQITLRPPIPSPFHFCNGDKKIMHTVYHSPELTPRPSSNSDVASAHILPPSSRSS